jgi:hypothetical protein
LGGSIVSDNVTARHLLNIKRLAFETNPINPAEPAELGRQAGWIDNAERRLASPPVSPPQGNMGHATAANRRYGTGLSEMDLDALIARFRKEIS